MKLFIVLILCCIPVAAQTQVSVSDGRDTNAGATTDAAVSGDTNGTLAAKLRQLNKIITLSWDNVNNRINVNIQNIPAVSQSGTWTVTTTPPSNASTNVSQINAVTPLMGNGVTGTGSQRVTIASDNTAFAVNNTQQGTASQNVAQIGGTTVVNGGLAGSLAVGGTAANNAAINQNPLLMAGEAIAQGSQPVAATAGNQRRILTTLEGSQFVQEGSSNRFSCFVQAVTVTTQCQVAPAAGLRAYVTSVSLSNQAATVQTLDLVFGTGANCVTGITALTHKWQMGTNATTTSPFELTHSFITPLVPTAATAICVRPSAASAFGATLTGYVAP